MKTRAGKWELQSVCHIEMFPSVNYREGGFAKDMEFMRRCEGLRIVCTPFPSSFLSWCETE
jgi:hypothetical protein